MDRIARLQCAGGISAAVAALLIPATAWAQDAAPAAAAAPPTPDTGDTAWMLVSSALVLLMTPGLALFYGGMARSKNILNMLMQSFAAMAIVTLVWVIAGYSVAFAPGNDFFGNASYMGLGDVGQGVFTLNGVSTTIPHQVFMIYQMMFAIITPALISGAIAERMKFGAYVVFIAAWSLLVYSPLAHMVWGEGGYLLKLGALDFAGGTVVHISSGISALVLAIMLGKRRLAPSEDVRPHNLPMTLIGTGLLWFGWFGFNAGSATASNGLAGSAFVVTHVAAATAALVWILIEWVTIKKPTALGFATGAVAGLVAITPASGFVSPISAIAIGFGVSCVSYVAIKMKSRLGYDDTLDVFGVHCIGGIWGALATGLFADKAVNAAVANNGLLLGGGGTLLGKQFIGVLVALAMGGIGTLVIAGIIKAVSGIRASTEDEEVGLDVSQHGEEGYHGGTSDTATLTGFGMASHGGSPVSSGAPSTAAPSAT
ncbi:MAG: ammonium transporter [Cytophagales bacterium]|nr:ammonium transporter [Armatimonadota bacterium]